MTKVKEKRVVKSNTNLIRKGDKLSRISYMEVVRAEAGRLVVRNEEGLEWTIGDDIIENECYTAGQFTETKEVTKTELAEIFSKVGDAIFKVNYHKQPKVEDVFDEIANRGKLPTNAELKKKLKEGMKGEERTLIGYMVAPEPLLGRSTVVDMEASTETKIRLVDHRSINWLICRNIKYVVKGKK